MKIAPRQKQASILPGFGLSLGVSVLYLTILVLLPLGALLLQASKLSFSRFIEAVSSPRVVHALELSFGASLAAAVFDSFCGLLLAWVLVRYRFPGRKLIDSLVDLPFALPTAVAGITLATLYSPGGWIGRKLALLNVQVAYTPLGIAVALAFVSLPFVVRSIQPVLEDLEPEIEDAAVCLGAGAFERFYRVILPELRPAILSGFSLAFARALGEYGSVVFISGNLPNRTEVMPLLIMTRLEQFDYTGATVLALVMLSASFALMLCVNSMSLRLRVQRGDE